MKLRLIPPGEFKMGSSREEIARLKKEIKEADERSPWLEAVERESAAHLVRLTRSYYLGVHEVTVAQFRRFVETTGYKTEVERDGKGGKILHSETGAYTSDPKATWRNPARYAVKDDYPVVQVSWNDAQEFCRWLSKMEGRTYRLPTEAEWEFACRAGSAGRFSFGDDPFEQGRYVVFDQPAPQPVGSRRPNRFGLFDMEGNALEWCGDWYGGPYSAAAQADPQGAPDGTDRVTRGGGHDDPSWACRCAARSVDPPSDRLYDTGFRVALDR
jgi:formylglycine-generating enzyme required for sulfatase activity